MSDQHEFIKRLANNMLLVPIRVGRLSLEVKTKKGAEAVKSALNIGENVRAGSSVGALGAMTDLAAELLNRPAGYASTYKYKRTLPSGEPIYRMAMTTKLPEHLARFNDHNNMIIKGYEEFMPQYEDYYHSNNGVADMGDSEIKIPHPDKVRGAVFVRVGVPQQIRPADLSDMNLPAGLAARIAADTNDKLIAQAEAAKAGAIKDLLETVSNIEKRLSTSNGRIHDSLLEKARVASANMRDLVTNYDNDFQILDAIDTVDKRITQATSEQVKNNATVREAAVRASKVVQTTLKNAAAKPAPIKMSQEQAGQILSGNDTGLGWDDLPDFS